MSDTQDPMFHQFLEWRGIAPSDACDRCSGSGSRMYASTATWHRGSRVYASTATCHGVIGGSAMTNGVCDKCWGSGDRYRPWINLRMVDAMQRTLRRIEGFGP